MNTKRIICLLLAALLMLMPLAALAEGDEGDNEGVLSEIQTFAVASSNKYFHP